MKKIIFTIKPEFYSPSCSDDLTEILEELKDLLLEGHTVTISAKEMEEEDFNNLPEFQGY